MNKFLLSAFLLGAVALKVVSLGPEDVRENQDRFGGVYYAYPEQRALKATVTAPPKGYEPFYVSHYGRHGSRYLISDRDYENVRRILADAKEAGALTPLGEDVLVRMKHTLFHLLQRFPFLH